MVKEGSLLNQQREKRWTSLLEKYLAFPFPFLGGGGGGHRGGSERWRSKNRELVMRCGKDTMSSLTTG